MVLLQNNNHIFLSILRANQGPLRVFVWWVGEACVSVVNEDVLRLFPVEFSNQLN